MIQNVSFTFLNFSLNRNKNPSQYFCFASNFHPFRQGSSLRLLLVGASLVETIHDHESLGRSLALWSQPLPLPARRFRCWRSVDVSKFSKKLLGEANKVLEEKYTNRHGFFLRPVSKEVGVGLEWKMCFFSLEAAVKKLKLLPTVFALTNCFPEAGIWHIWSHRKHRSRWEFLKGELPGPLDYNSTLSQ